VLIEWLDAGDVSADWSYVADVPPIPLRCRSVGWIIRETDTCKLLAPHVADPIGDVPRQMTGNIVILNGAITRITELTIPVGDD